MKEQLGKYRLLEPIGPGGHAVVYRAEEDMGHGFVRPTAVKVLQGLDDEKKIAVLRREVEVLIELSSCPNIVTIYGLGIDEDVGPWIAMELGGRSLMHFIAEEPADPDQVRVMLRDALHALATVHGADPPVLHRDMKPNNILSTEFGNWVIVDFGLARRWEADDTVQLATVQYAAPELLDATLGPESPRMDLYSLGMTAYEFALGHQRYREQFPSVYDPYAGKEAAHADLRPKWMYWHTSMQMTVPPLAELIDGCPEHLSDLIATMMAKPVDKRPESAREALTKLGNIEGGIALAVEPPEVVEEVVIPQRWRAPALVALAVILITLLATTFLMVRANAPPAVEMAPMFVGAAPINVTGSIKRFPRGGGATIELDDGSPFPVTGPYADGSFVSEVVPRQLGEYQGMLKIRDAQGRLVGKPHRVVVRRTEPTTVDVVLATHPVVPGTRLVITSSRRPEEPMEHRIGQDGKARVEVPYGDFELEVTHPRFRPKSGSMHTGFENTLEPPPIRMDEIPMGEIYAEMRDLIARIRVLATKKCTCPPGPLTEPEARDLERRVEKLHALGEGDLDIEAFVDAVSGVRECEPDSLAAVDATVETVTAAINEKEEQLAREEEEARQGSSAAAGSRDGGAGGGTGDAATTDELVKQLIAAGVDPEVVEALVAAGAVAAGQLPSLSEVDRQTLLDFPLNIFQKFIEANVPSGPLTVAAVPEIDAVRVSGPLFNEDELNRLANRLLPAMTRLQLELRVDAWAVCRRLQKKLEEDGVEAVRVHAHLTPGDHGMFVSFIRDDAHGSAPVTDVAREYVIDPDLLFVRGVARPEP